jgi:GT2 family glycosyltransferase
MRSGQGGSDVHATGPLVTVVVSPRECFSYARDSLASIFAHTQSPFSLVYVDGGSPRALKQHLEARAREAGFRLIRTEHYLSPNRARNLGLRHVTTKYVVFIDNDVIVTPGWLSALVECAEATGATIVSPLICEGEPAHTIVHCAGGECGVREEARGDGVRRLLIDKIHDQGRPVAELAGPWRPTGLAEFHCMLVRMEFLQQLGGLDEALLNTKEHIDLCMSATQTGGTIFLEPRALVTYAAGPLRWSDMPYYMLRWSDAWERSSLEHLLAKWKLTEDDYFQRRYRQLGWRRRMAIIDPLSRRLAFGHGVRTLQKALLAIDRVANSRITRSYARRHAQSY